MSADNGIYILDTPRNGTVEISEAREYRVRELMAVENIEYDKDAPDPNQFRPDYGNEYHSPNEMLAESNKFYEAHKKYQEAYTKKYHSNNPDVLIHNAREMFNKCEVFYIETEALAYAARLLRECWICEYGISFIRIERVF